MYTTETSLAKIAVNKSLLKEYSSNREYSRIVYLNNNSEFQIQLFNPYTYTIGADIAINGINMSNRIVIHPGQRIWLERYLDDNRKFMFSTYEVEDTAQVRSAIVNNGVIEINFYKEQVNSTPFYTYTPKSYNYMNANVRTPLNQVLYSSTIGDTLSLDSAQNCSCSVNSAATYSSVTGDAGESNFSASAASTRSARSLDTIETGRIEKGSHSNQRFDNVFIDFEYSSFKTEKIQLLPTSRKPITSKDLQKVYCVQCGRKLNTKYKYCPYCGAKVRY